MQRDYSDDSNLFHMTVDRVFPVTTGFYLTAELMLLYLTLVTFIGFSSNKDLTDTYVVLLINLVTMFWATCACSYKPRN